MIEIECPSCGISGKISLDRDTYYGPYRCWKCRRIYVIEIRENKVKEIEEISQDEFEKWKERQRIEKWRLSNQQERD